MTAVEDHQDDMVAIMDSLGEDYPERFLDERSTRVGSIWRRALARADGARTEGPRPPEPLGWAALSSAVAPVAWVARSGATCR